MCIWTYATTLDAHAQHFTLTMVNGPRLLIICTSTQALHEHTAASTHMQMHGHLYEHFPYQKTQ